MAAGRWVFPVVIVSFLLFLTMYVATNPAEPAPEGASRFQRVAPGHVVLVELTQYYDAQKAYVTYTTDEALHQSGDFNASPQGVGFDARPLEIEIPEATSPQADNLFGALLGRRAGETFTTPRYADFYGRFQEERTLDTTVTSMPRVVSATQGEQNFEYEQFKQFWARNLGRDLQEGDRIACEQRFPWQCEILELDDEAQRFTFRRAVSEGDEIAPRTILPFASGTPVPSSPLVVHTNGDEPFELEWRLEEGDAFVLAGTVGDWSVGAYKVSSVTDGQAVVQYAPQTSRVVPAHLIGHEVWFEITVVEIHTHEEDDHAQA